MGKFSRVLRKRLFTGLLVIAIAAQGYAQSKLDSLITVLDKTIENEAAYITSKSEAIEKIKKQLPKAKSLEDRYFLYYKLGENYQVFVADSAQHYSNLAIGLARELNDSYKLNQSRILLASVESKTGMFPISLDILKQIDQSVMDTKQRIEYLKTLSEVYIYWMEYQQGHETEGLVQRREELRDSLIAILPPSSMEYAVNLGTKYIEQNRLEEAEEILRRNYEPGKENTRDYSIYMSILAYLYEMKGDREAQMHNLALSAISDVRGSIMENLSLRTLAVKLYEKGDLQRANFYIKKSLRDANLFNARLRNLQVSRILPIIDKAYEEEKLVQERRLKTLLIVVTLLSIVLLGAAVLIFRQMKKVSRSRKEVTLINEKLTLLNEALSKANQKQAVMNEHLSESNLVKEQYIHSFLEMCTEYIARLENFKRIAGGKLRSGQGAELLKIVESSQMVNDELKELYRNFDKAFLNVYPNFVSQLNALLRTEEEYEERQDGSLNHELRVFALIRLGVNDQNQIATFLHYSVRTVYNYRSKVKNKALNPEAFESQILGIGLQNDTI
ncbi:DUF6377 domain-containing protein [Chryseobacterium sp. A321]